MCGGDVNARLQVACSCDTDVSAWSVLLEVVTASGSSAAVAAATLNVLLMRSDSYMVIIVFTITLIVCFLSLVCVTGQGLLRVACWLQ